MLNIFTISGVTTTSQSDVSSTSTDQSEASSSSTSAPAQEAVVNEDDAAWIPISSEASVVVGPVDGSVSYPMNFILSVHYRIVKIIIKLAK